MVYDERVQAARRAIELGLLLGLAACAEPAAFRCETDAQCGSLPAGDRCEATGYCSVQDDGCLSERRYAELVGDGLAGTCVVLEDAAGADDADGTSASDEGGIAPTAGSIDDPYGRCAVSMDCGTDGARCLESSEGDEVFSMCSPPCTTPAEPSTECPGPLGDGYTVGCLPTGAADDAACFIQCGPAADCPNGMICALSAVCSWQ